MVKRGRIAKSGRPYQLRARADAMDRTRARITRAAIELHGSIGPAATTMSAVAERAGVTRATLYRHFPNEGALFTACSAEWRSANPSPNPAQWAAIADPYDRLRSRCRRFTAGIDQLRPCGPTCFATSRRCHPPSVPESSPIRGPSPTCWTPAGRVDHDCAGRLSATASPSRPGSRWHIRA